MYHPQKAQICCWQWYRGRPKAIDKAVDETGEEKVAEIQAAHRLSELRQQTAMLGYDRFWNRYWLLAGPTPSSSCELACPAFTCRIVLHLSLASPRISHATVFAFPRLHP